MAIFNIVFFSLLLFISTECVKSELIVKESVSVTSVELKQSHLPLNYGAENAGVFELRLAVTTEDEALILNNVEVLFDAESNFAGIESISAKYSGVVNGSDTNVLFGTSKKLSQKTNISGTRELGTVIHFLKFGIGTTANRDLISRFRVEKIILSFKNHKPISVSTNDNYIFRSKMVLWAAGQDNTNTYRIPGLITTSKGTLIAVYDNRYNNSKDLQEDIDIGMSRSTLA